MLYILVWFNVSYLEFEGELGLGLGGVDLDVVRCLLGVKVPLGPGDLRVVGQLRLHPLHLGARLRDARLHAGLGLANAGVAADLGSAGLAEGL